ncbi:hypothetical protein D7Z54_28265 [Salibacterium salarium]|uniref:Uncharacterized protein n=1 Tax=Salibacterium salarium TaxID=284579 RepID=A0A3R9QNP9_9BACI|nr:CBO0543 family protein [Salibacterium salarium]RSL30000.1 hypothetical protein D7Z54_28265 [Salibacterium salarium]
MRDKTILNVTTALGFVGIMFLFRKGPIKEWFLVYLLKSLLCTFLDVPVVQKKLVKYPKRYFPRAFDSNIVFVYVIFPVFCVFYNQFTYKMNVLKTIPSVFLFSTPMAVVEKWLEKNTRLVEYGKGWDSIYTMLYLTFSFWFVRLFMSGIRWLDRNRKVNEDCFPEQ